MKALVVIPTYKEEHSLPPLIHKIIELYPKLSVVVVDDNSPDGTQAVVQDLMKTYPQVSLFRRSKKTGLGDAYRDILQRISQKNDIDYIITMDADGSHDPEHLQHLLAAMNTHDIAIGSRYIRGGAIRNWNRMRRLLSWAGNIYVKAILRMPINDLTSGFVCFKRKILKDIDLSTIASMGYSYQIEFKWRIIKRGYRAREIPITFTDRKLGTSKMATPIIWEGLKLPFTIK